MGGRFGKYGETKRISKLRRSRQLARQGQKNIPPKGMLRHRPSKKTVKKR